MKKLYTTILMLCMTVSLLAQAPEKMSYQAVVRDGNDRMLINTPLGMQISILQGTVSGNAVYMETHTPTTNANGLVSLEIGTGTVEIGTLGNIDWSQGPYFVVTETDPSGGTNYTIKGVSQLLSVPYALHAKTAENGMTQQYISEIATNTLKVGITTQQAADITTNNAKVGYTDALVSANADVAANTLKVGITTEQANEIAANTLKTGITGAQTTKLAGIADGAEVNVQADWNQATTTADDYIKNKPTIPSAADGSETKINAGTNISVTGSGTTASPYVVNATIPSPTYTVGLNPDLGGYVFFVTPDGKHGLVAATQDQSPATSWFTAQDFISNPATHNADGKKFTDWRLPTKYELNEIFKQWADIGGFYRAKYWSSSAFNNDFAWFQNFPSGTQSNQNKTGALRVRAVRSF